MLFKTIKRKSKYLLEIMFLFKEGKMLLIAPLFAQQYTISFNFSITWELGGAWHILQVRALSVNI